MTGAAIPRDRIEADVLRQFETVLGLAVEALDDDFFALGGSSLRADEFLRGVSSMHGVRVAFDDFFAAPTVAGVATIVRRGEARRDPRLVTIADGLWPPLFALPASGEVVELWPLRTLGLERSVVAIRAQGLNDGESEVADVVDRATSAIADIQAVVPHGPYALLGWCAGGMVAFEIARQLEARGAEVGPVVLVDSPPGRAPVGATLEELLRRNLQRYAPSRRAARTTRVSIDAATAEATRRGLVAAGTTPAEFERRERVYAANEWGHGQYLDRLWRGVRNAGVMVSAHVHLVASSAHTYARGHELIARYAPNTTVYPVAAGHHDVLGSADLRAVLARVLAVEVPTS